MESYVAIRYRINGSLCLINKIENDLYMRLCSKIKIRAGMDITDKRKPQDGKIILRYKEIKYDLRISSIPVIYGEKLVIRILYFLISSKVTLWDCFKVSLKSDLISAIVDTSSIYKPHSK